MPDLTVTWHWTAVERMEDERIQARYRKDREVPFTEDHQSVVADVSFCVR